MRDDCYLVSLPGRPQFAPGKYWLRVSRGHTLQVCLTAGPDTHIALPGHDLGLRYNTEGGQLVELVELVDTRPGYICTRGI